MTDESLSIIPFYSLIIQSRRVFVDLHIKTELKWYNI